MHINGLESPQLGVLLIDAQPAFWEYAFPDDKKSWKPIMQRMEHLLMFAGWMDLPVITTFEEPVSQNGELPEELEKVFPLSGQRFTKRTYNATLEPEIAAAIRNHPVTQWAVAGAETDVCVLQSVLGLLRLDYQVFALEDCLFTSEPHPGPALRRMNQSGAVMVTLKTMLYELASSTERTPWYPEGWARDGRDHLQSFPKDFIPPENWLEWEPRV